jgi:uncharacterized protein YndB with AHSA1/START domain
MSAPDTPGITLTHDTFVLERDFAVSPSEVFAAYKDPDERVRWAAPPGHGMKILQARFEIGGTDDYVCGPGGDLRLNGTLHYLDIQEDARIIFAERIADGDRPLAMSLVSWTFEPIDKGTHVTVLTQVTSLVGEDMLAGSRGGRSIVLDNLASQLGVE